MTTANRCPGCDNADANTNDGCCTLYLDSDGLPGRCVGDWTEDKHYFLDHYCDIFCRGMKKKWKNRVYVDLFAGPGRCRVRPNGYFCNGSPLIAAEHGFTHMALVDISPDCIESVTTRLNNHPNRHRIEVFTHCGDSNELVDDLVGDVQGIGHECLGFTFVDPPGIEIAFDTLASLSTSIRTDLLLNFPLGMNIKRQFWHQWNSDPDRECGFDRFFGTPEWRDHVESHPGGIVKVGQSLLDFYMARLRSLGYSYVGDSQIVKTQGRSLYHLIFASQSPRGREFWNKICQIPPTGQRRLY